MKLKVEVNKRIIQEAASCPLVPHSSVLLKKFQDEHLRDLISNCLVSRAVREIFPQAVTMTGTEFGVLYAFIDPFNEGDDENNIMLPGEVAKAIDGFDYANTKERLLIKPFTFEIDVPASVIERIGISQAYKALSEARTVSLVSIF